MDQLPLDKASQHILDLAYSSGMGTGQSLPERLLEILMSDLEVSTEIGALNMSAKNILLGLRAAQKEDPPVDISLENEEELYFQQVENIIGVSTRHARMYGRTKVTPIDMLAAASYIVPTSRKTAELRHRGIDGALTELRTALFGRAATSAMINQHQNDNTPALGYNKARTPRDRGISADDETAFQAFGKFLPQTRSLPFHGRENEVYKVERTLDLTRKPNVMLIGDGGVGKSAIIEELAAQGRFLVFSVEISKMVEGTTYRGDFEKKMNALIALGERYKDNVVIFIDEIHTVMGAGQAAGSPLDASNALKATLARGGLHLVGCTTYAEYRRHIEKNPAFDRRFTKVFIDEPPREDAIKILAASVDDIADHHDVIFRQECFALTYDLAVRYLRPKKMPDIGFDVLDMAAHRAQEHNGRQGKAQVDAADIAYAVSEIAGIPQATMSKSDRDRVLTLEQDMKGQIFGQDGAIEKIVRRTANAVTLPNENSVRDSMLFTGPTGVGKTEVAKLLAHHLDMNFMRFDMSEFMERHSVSRLIGAPPGYVGYDKGGLMANEIRRKPHTLLLLDEIEKAHPDVFNILLQILSNGSFTDGQDNQVDCQNLIIILSTNIGQGEIRNGIGFTASKNGDAPHAAFAKFFSPELRGRMGESIEFEKLGQSAMQNLTRKFLAAAAAGVQKESGISVAFDQTVEDSVVKNGFSPEFGARPTQAFVRFKVMDALVTPLLRQEIRRGDLVRIFAGTPDTEFSWEKVDRTARGIVHLPGRGGVMHLAQE